MASKIGTLVERLISCGVWFAPDGSNIGTVEAPIVTGRGVKPATDLVWADYNLGKVTKAAYDPKTKDRTREWGKLTGGYQERTDKIILQDAFNLTMIEYPDALFDQLMFGLESQPVADTPQAVFVNAQRFRDGWLKFKRINEDGSIITLLEIRVRLSIGEHPEDSSEAGSPVWRVEHLGDATGGLEEITVNPEAE